MKKRIYIAIFALTAGLCAGCGSRNAESNIAGMENAAFGAGEPSELSDKGNIGLSEENKAKKMLVPMKRILISNQPILRRSILRAIILRTSKKM